MVAPGQEALARRVVANCPEYAIAIIEGQVGRASLADQMWSVIPWVSATVEHPSDKGADMARYGEHHKPDTRRRILGVAGRRLKRDGIDASGIAALMHDADLTNGAFYAHFASKEDLVTATITEQIGGQRASIAALPPGRAGLEQVVRSYLSREHRDDPGSGCPSAALLDEIGRCPDAVRRAYTDGMVGLIDDLAARLAPTDRSAARVLVFTVFATMVGTLQLSRALTDRELSDAILEQGLEHALTLLRP